MKKVLVIITLIVFVGGMMSCTSTENSFTTSKDRPESFKPYVQD